MNPVERAGLLRHGVTYAVIQHLESGGYTELEQLAKATHQQLAAIPGVGTLGAGQVQRGLRELMDAELNRTRNPQ